MNKREALIKLRNCPSFHDFTIVHRSIEYPINKLLITTISPVVSKLIFSENPVDSIELPPIEGPMDAFIDMMYGVSIRIDQVNCRFFNFMAKELGITQLIKVTEDFVEKTNTLDNVIRFAEQLVMCNLDASKEIGLIAYNFLNIVNNPYMKLCSPKLILEILKHDSFKYDDQIVIQFLTNLINANPEKFKELQPLLYSFCESRLTNFAVLSSVLDLRSNQNEITSKLINMEPSDSKLSQKLIPRANKDNGFFKYAKSFITSTMSPVDNEMFKLTSSKELATEKSTYSVRHLIDGSLETSFNTEGSSNEYILVNLNKGSLQLTHYSLTSIKEASKGFCPESWVIDGSSDGEFWVEIDRVEHDKSLMHPLKTRLFKVKTISPDLKFIRFTQIDTCSSRNKRLMLSGIELYGKYHK